MNIKLFIAFLCMANAVLAAELEPKNKQGLAHDFMNLVMLIKEHNLSRLTEQEIKTFTGEVKELFKTHLIQHRGVVATITKTLDEKRAQIIYGNHYRGFYWICMAARIAAYAGASRKNIFDYSATLPHAEHALIAHYETVQGTSLSITCYGLIYQMLQQDDRSNDKSFEPSLKEVRKHYEEVLSKQI